MANKLLKWISFIHDAIDLRLVQIGSVIVIVMMSLSIIDILMRDVFVKPLSGTYELMCLMMTVIVFLPFAHVQAKESQIAITIFSDILPPKVQKILGLLWLVTAFLGMVIVAWQGTVATIEAVQTHEVTVGLIQFPTAPSRGVLAFGASMLCIRLLRQIVESIHKFSAGSKTE